MTDPETRLRASIAQLETLPDPGVTTPPTDEQRDRCLGCRRRRPLYATGLCRHCSPRPYPVMGRVGDA